MARILAIEHDSSRQALLRSVIAGRIDAELILVNTVADGIGYLSPDAPDVVLVPTLLSPRDVNALMAAIKEKGAPQLQILNTPAIDVPAERPATTRFRLGRRALAPVRIDPAILAGLVSDALRRAAEIRAEQDARDAHARWCAERGDVTNQIPEQRQLRATTGAENRRRCERMARAEVPWISAVRMPWGLDLNLVNISTGGILLESGTKLPPGITYDLQLDAVEATLVVKARVIRAEVSRVDRGGVRYYLAAAFEQHVDLTGRRRVPSMTMPQALAELMATVVADGSAQEPSDVRFARGLRKLVRARDVLVRRAPIAPADGSESIFFNVDGDGRSRRILQILFDPDRPLNAAEFAVLKAAASMTAALQQLDRCAVQPDRMLQSRAIEVA